MARDHVGSETIDYVKASNDGGVVEMLKEMTGGRGPEGVIDAVGMEGHGTGVGYAYDRVKQALHLESDRASALRTAIMAVRKGGVLSVLGVYGLIDKFPMGVIMNKGLTVGSAQQHGQKYMPRLLEHAVKGELDPSFMATHRFDLEDSVRGYDMFINKTDGCVRAVFSP
jgi:threonine dehydrogenase-like Zn-dependent dehydrogenase